MSMICEEAEFTLFQDPLPGKGGPCVVESSFSLFHDHEDDDDEQDRQDKRQRDRLS